MMYYVKSKTSFHGQIVVASVLEPNSFALAPSKNKIPAFAPSKNKDQLRLLLDFFFSEKLNYFSPAFRRKRSGSRGGKVLFQNTNRGPV